MSLVRTSSRNCGAPLSTRGDGRAKHVNCFVPLPHYSALSIVIAEDSPNWVKVETSVAGILTFESPSTAFIEEGCGVLGADMECVTGTDLAGPRRVSCPNP